MKWLIQVLYLPVGLAGLLVREYRVEESLYTLLMVKGISKNSI